MARILCNVAGGGKPLKGNAETGDVLAGKTFSNKQSNALTGSMPNNGALNVTLTPSGNNSTSQAVAAGYYSGGKITANGSSSYSKGVSDADARVNTSSASYKSGYNSGYAKGNSEKPSNFKIGVAVTAKRQGFSGTTYAWGSGCHVVSEMSVKIDAGYYYHVAVYNGNENSKSWVTNKNGYASSALTFNVTDGNERASMAVVMASNYPIF